MDISKSLATESFSYSWLAIESSSSKTEQNNTSTESLALDEASHNFDFNIINSKPNFSEVHADKLFCNGFIKPRNLEVSSNTKNYEAPTTTATISLPSTFHANHQIHPAGASDDRRSFLKLWRKLPRKIINKYVRCLIPVKGSRSRIRVVDVNRKAWEVKSWNNDTPTEAASPRRNSATSANCSVWNETDGSSINDAILYCKRSSGLQCS